jgi:membrane protease YdiL (CAAX protease family)
MMIASTLFSCSLFRSALRVPQDRASITLVVFLCAQLIGLFVAAFLFGVGFRELLPTLSFCGNWTAVVWAPMWEEFVFRFTVFYLVLQRSHGNVPFACAVSALSFSAIHLANILAPFGSTADWGTVLFALLQCSVAVVCGFTYSLVFAATGSLGAVVAMHSLNNATAVSWMSIQRLGVGYESAVDDPSAPCLAAPRWTISFSAAIFATLVVHVVVAALAYFRLGRLASPGFGSSDDSAPGKSKPAKSATRDFSVLHELVYS